MYMYIYELNWKIQVNLTNITQIVGEKNNLDTVNLKQSKYFVDIVIILLYNLSLFLNYNIQGKYNIPFCKLFKLKDGNI